MEENLADTLQRASDVMHFFERYRLANALTLLSRLVRARGIHTLDQLQEAVDAEEAHHG